MTKGSRQNRCVTSGEALAQRAGWGSAVQFRRLGYDLGWRYLRAMLSGVVALRSMGCLYSNRTSVRACAGLVAPL